MHGKLLPRTKGVALALDEEGGYGQPGHVFKAL
jgi:hypothetical protein